jgi:hypothetical protein
MGTVGTVHRWAACECLVYRRCWVRLCIADWLRDTGCALAAQVYRAALGVVERPHADGDGADQGGRGRALQEEQ